MSGLLKSCSVSASGLQSQAVLTWRLLWPKRSAFRYTALCITTESIMWRTTEESCWTWILSPEYDHLCPWGGSIDGSVQFPSVAPKKRLIQGLTSHLDDPGVRGEGYRDHWRGFIPLCPCCFDTLLLWNGHSLGDIALWSTGLYI